MFTADSSTYEMLFLSLASLYLLLILFLQTIVCKRPHNFLFTTEIRKEVCVNKHPGYSFAIANDMRCMDTQVKSSYAFSLPLLQECWKRITGVQPKLDSDYVEIYCRDESPYILVNMVHDCFLQSFVMDRVETMEKNKTRNESRMNIVNDLYRDVHNKCSAYVYGKYNGRFRENQYPKSEISEFVSCMDVEYNNFSDIHDLHAIMHEGRGPVSRFALKYFESLYELKDPAIAKQENRGYCQTDGTKKVGANIRCLKQRAEGNEAALNKCFKDITLTSPYPTSDGEIKSYLCDGDNKIPYPLAIMKTIEQCLDTYLNVERHERKESCFTEQLLKETGEDKYYSMLPEDTLEITYYNQICLVKNFTAFKEMIVGDFGRPYNAMVCTAEKFKKESVGKSNVGKVIDYCWSFFMSHGQFVNSTVKEIPNSHEEWMKFYCSHDYYNKRMALPSFRPMNFCMQRMLQLDSRSIIGDSKISNPRRSRDEETLMKCLRLF